MIDLNTEQPVPLCEVRLPGRGGKPVHFSTVWRWVTRGVRGPNGERIRLAALRLGSRWVTSALAIQQFAEKLTPEFSPAAPPARTLRQAGRAAERAGQRLAEAGA
jgi:hypothetical protein